MPRRSSPSGAAAPTRSAWPTSTPREPRYSQSLARGLAILTAFTPQRPVLGIAEIAREVGMSRSTTHRYVITLLALGYLEQGASRKYRLGLGVTRLGLSALGSTPLREHARPYLEELRERYPYTSNLGVLDDGELLVLQRVRGPGRTRASGPFGSGPGLRLPAHCTAIGKLLLAYLPQPQREELVSSLTLEACGPRTITSRRALREELARIRAAGMATSSEEIAPQLQAVAVPVRDDAGEVVAGVNLVSVGSRMGLEELLEQVAAQLQATAGRISARLGHRPAEAPAH